MESMIIVKAIQTCTVAPVQWDAWDSDGNYWYLRFRGCRGTMSKDYDVDQAVREFYDDSVDERIGDITLKDMCLSLGLRLDLERGLNRIELAPERPKNFVIGQNRKIERTDVDTTITLIKADQIASLWPVVHWNAWDVDGNFWYLRYDDGHGTMSKDYDVDNAVRSFDIGASHITLDDMCRFLRIFHDPNWLDRVSSKVKKAPIFPTGNPFNRADRKIEIDAPRPGNVKFVIASGDKWATVEIDRLGIDLVTVLQALQEMDEMIE